MLVLPESSLDKLEDRIDYLLNQKAFVMRNLLKMVNDAGDLYLKSRRLQTWKANMQHLREMYKHRAACRVQTAVR